MAEPERMGLMPGLTRRDFLRATVGTGMGFAVACAPGQRSPTEAGARLEPAVKRPDEIKRGNLRGITFHAAIAKARGYYREVGIEDEDILFDSGAQMAQAMAAGEIDVLATSNTAAFYNILGRGLKQPFVSDNWHLERGDRSYVIAIRPDLVDSIKELPDLAGRRSATSTPEKDGGSWFVAKKMFDAVGMKLEDVQWERLAFPDMLAAFANRSIDAAWLIEPFITLGKQRNLLVPWLSLGDFDPGAQIAGLVFSERLIKERTDVARRWMLATLRGARDFNDFLAGKGREVIGPILASHTGVAPELVDQVGWGPVHPDGRLNLDSLMQAQQLLREWGKIDQILPLEQIVDHQFVEYAVAQLGPYRS